MTKLAHIFDGGAGRTLSPSAEKMVRWLMANPNVIHSRNEISAAAGFPEGRSADTYASEIRKALGKIDGKIIVSPGVGYGWIGEPVALVAVARGVDRRVTNPYMADFAVMTRDEVAKILKISSEVVGQIERKALKKLKAKPELKERWKEMLAQRQRVHYDPYYEIWMFSVAERIATEKPEEREDNEID